MAYQIASGWQIDGAGNRVCNVHYSVGLGGANYTDDVMLVQFFLKRIFAAPDVGWAAPSTAPLKVDGLCGPITRSWIKRFQTWMQMTDVPPSSVRVDSRVSRAPDEGYNGNYTIVMLNDQYARRHPEDRVESAPDAPLYLRKSLSSNTIIHTHGGGI